MKESNTTDIDNEKFPDPLSTTFNDIQLTKVPPRVKEQIRRIRVIRDRF